jgi:hypothetical protein
VQRAYQDYEDYGQSELTETVIKEAIVELVMSCQKDPYVTPYAKKLRARLDTAPIAKLIKMTYIIMRYMQIRNPQVFIRNATVWN